jgi:hypothetical protein
MPRARSAGLVVETLADDTLVYDLDSHTAHCLNRTATLVWRRCDGHTALSAMAAIVGREVGIAASERLVCTGVKQLHRARLLEDVPPAAMRGPDYARREVIRALGLTGAAALLVPFVESIVAPVPAEAGSCITLVECLTRVPPSCTDLPICGAPNTCCLQRGTKCQARGC